MLEEEQALLAKVLEALAKATPAGKGGDLRSVAALKALRDEAVSARDDDLPAMLQEMNVRQRLVVRQNAGLPDFDSPYLAHLQVDEGAGPRDYLLGRVTFLDSASGVRIVDWRMAPIAQVFYGYGEGEEYEVAFPGRTARGVVTARRVVVIENGELTRVMGDQHTLVRGARGVWTAIGRNAFTMQSGGAGTSARPGTLGMGIGSADRGAGPEVTALLDSGQFDAIRVPAELPLLVLGSAGSGKTTVALHRLSRVAASDPVRYPAARMEVITPEEGLARLSRRLLDGLGVGEAQVSTLERWSSSVARAAFDRPLKINPLPPPLVTAVKRHHALYRALHARYATKGTTGTIGVLRRRLAEVFTDRAFLQRVVEDSKGDLRLSAIEEMVTHTMAQIARSAEKEFAGVDEARKAALDGRSLGEGTPEELAGTIDIDDLPILLCMRAWRGEVGQSGYAHLVLDEAEDFSLFELFVLRALQGDRRSITVAGDDAQQTASSFSGWQASLDTLGVANAETCRLEISYRCPRPIAELARVILGELAPSEPVKAARDGAPVGAFHFPDEAHLNLFLSDALKDLLGREPKACVAVIAHDEDTARRVYASLVDLPEARLVLEGDFNFEPGVDVTDVDNAKGLEFDYVVVPDASVAAYPDSSDARRRLHVAATRASHQLWLTACGTPTPIVGELAFR